MEKPKSQKQIASLFERRMNSYERHHDGEVKAFSRIPEGYGMRAYSRLKHAANHSGEVRDKLEDMVREYKIEILILADAVRRRILSAGFVNEHQGTNF